MPENSSALCLWTLSGQRLENHLESNLWRSMRSTINWFSTHHSILPALCECTFLWKEHVRQSFLICVSENLLHAKKKKQPSAHVNVPFHHNVRVYSAAQ